MVRPIATRFVSFLDRFDEQLQVDCERMKRELSTRVDQQFGVMRAKVNELKNRFSHSHTSSSLNIEGIFADNPSVEVISFGYYFERKRSEAASELQNASTSPSGNRKRKQQTGASASKNAKKAKTQSNAISNGQNVKFACKFLGCDRSFLDDWKLANHERIHLNIKPYFCTWPDCKHSSQQYQNIVKHIRTVHFKLPRSVKKQNELNIVDDRDPNEFVRVDQQLANRRL